MNKTNFCRKSHLIKQLFLRLVPWKGIFAENAHIVLFYLKRIKKQNKAKTTIGMWLVECNTRSAFDFFSSSPFPSAYYPPPLLFLILCFKRLLFLPHFCVASIVFLDSGSQVCLISLSPPDFLYSKNNNFVMIMFIFCLNHKQLLKCQMHLRLLHSNNQTPIVFLFVFLLNPFSVAVEVGCATEFGILN